MKRPGSLTLAVVLEWIVAILGLFVGFGLVVGALAMTDSEFTKDIEQALVDNGITGVTASQITWGVMGVGIVALLIGIFRIILAIFLGAGRNWARIIVTVFAVFSMLSAIAGFFQGGTQLAASIVWVAIEVVVLWLMYNAKSNAFIASRSA